jgi:hypothetical protein
MITEKEIERYIYKNSALIAEETRPLARGLFKLTQVALVKEKINILKRHAETTGINKATFEVIMKEIAELEKELKELE